MNESMKETELTKEERTLVDYAVAFERLRLKKLVENLMAHGEKELQWNLALQAVLDLINEPKKE